jgi:mannosylglycerate hydrolase MGH1-like protein
MRAGSASSHLRELANTMTLFEKRGARNRPSVLRLPFCAARPGQWPQRRGPSGSVDHHGISGDLGMLSRRFENGGGRLMRAAKPYPRETLEREVLATRAEQVLRKNDMGGWTKAAPELYPHQWSWDSAFIAVGLAHLDTARAARELLTIFAHQWKTGRFPISSSTHEPRLGATSPAPSTGPARLFRRTPHQRCPTAAACASRRSTPSPPCVSGKSPS